MSFITNRLTNAILWPVNALEPAKEAVTTIEGALASILSVATLGLNPKINERSHNTVRSAYLLPKLYKNTMEIINPEFKNNFSHIPPGSQRYGHFSNYVEEKFQEGKKSAINKDFIERHIISRISYAFGGIASVTRIADFALGIFSAAWSIIKLGQDPRYNRIATNNFTCLGFIDDICTSIRGVVNPHQNALYKNH